MSHSLTLGRCLIGHIGDDGFFHMWANFVTDNMAEEVDFKVDIFVIRGGHDQVNTIQTDGNQYARAEIEAALRRLWNRFCAEIAATCIK